MPDKNGTGPRSKPRGPGKGRGGRKFRKDEKGPHGRCYEFNDEYNSSESKSFGRGYGDRVDNLLGKVLNSGLDILTKFLPKDRLYERF